jgi:hypothetical protein
MARFNKWETDHCRRLTQEERLKQFFILYGLGKMNRNEVLDKMHEDHLMGLIKTHERLKK